MVLGLDSKPLILRVVREALGNRPALKNAIVLKAKVKVDPLRVMLLHDVNRLFASQLLRRWFGGRSKVPFFLVLLKHLLSPGLSCILLRIYRPVSARTPAPVGGRPSYIQGTCPHTPYRERQGVPP